MTTTKNEPAPAAPEPQDGEVEVPDFGDWYDLRGAGELIAVYRGTHSGSFGDVHDLVTMDGEPVSLPGWAMLSRKLEQVGPGHVVRIVYRGELEPSKKGQNGAADVAVFDRGLA